MILVIVLQSSNVIDRLKIGNIKPNLIMLFIIYISLTTNILTSETTGFFVGFLEDILSQSLIGVNALTKTLLAFFLNHFKTRLFTEKIISVFFVVFLTTIVTKLFYFLLILLFVNKVNFYHAILKIIIPEAFYNALFSIVVFPLFRLILERKRLWQKP